MLNVIFHVWIGEILTFFFPVFSPNDKQDFALMLNDKM